MRLVKWTDENGNKRFSYVRDGDSDDLAQYGIPADPPDLATEIDWDSVIAEMQAELVKHGFINWRAIQHGQNHFGSVLSPVKRAVITLYRQKSKEI